VQTVMLVASSDSMMPDQFSDSLGMQCDEAIWRGARQSDPPIPWTNQWWIVTASGGPVDECIEELLIHIVPMVERRSPAEPAQESRGAQRRPQTARNRGGAPTHRGAARLRTPLHPRGHGRRATNHGARQCLRGIMSS
jgi:hypothetical protein